VKTIVYQVLVVAQVSTFLGPRALL